MTYRLALSFMLLQNFGAVSAFQTLPTHHNNSPRLKLLQQSSSSPSPASALQTASLESIPTLESILEDGHGHINSNLAQAIYEWEVAHNGQQDHQFSSRDGLRLVDELVREILTSLGENEIGESSNYESKKASDISYNDLVQEGMFALLRAMSTYDNYKVHTTANNMSTFREYAKQSIQSSLLHFLAHSSRPIRLPLSLQTTLQTANIAAKKLRKILGKEPSLVQVAKEVEIAPEQLALYRKLYRSMVSRVGTFVSMEDGMEVYDPTLAGVGGGTGFRSRRDMDSMMMVNVEGNNDGTKREEKNLGGSSSSTSNNINNNNNNDERDLLHLNSQEDDWTREPPERTVAPLRDILTDTEEINNPLSYTHHFILNEELNEFLNETLTEEELTVIQLRFGLLDSKHGGKGWTTNEIGVRMEMDREDVVRVATGALEKLRKGAATNWEEDNDAYVEISL